MFVLLDVDQEWPSINFSVIQARAQDNKILRKVLNFGSIVLFCPITSFKTKMYSSENIRGHASE